jgi:O-antigen/teichoic acid export membrane protein
VVLDVLGLEDYGINSVVGGVVTFFSFLSGTMASATQRFFSFSLGTNDQRKLTLMFTINWVIYGCIAFFALLLLETIGLWFVYNYLNVPGSRFSSVLFIYQFSIITFLLSILSAPFMALIIAHENMEVYAYISILEALLKLVVVFLLVILPWDKLEVYSVLLFSVSCIVSCFYLVFCVSKYSECQFKKFFWDRELFREIIGFTGWTLFGQLTSVARNQAITILINQFFNPITVAARSIATTISNQVNIFSSNFNVGLYPPIIKSYATNDKEQMFSLIYRGSKITFFLMWILALPLFMEMETILRIWLKNPPSEAVLFSRLMLIESLIMSVSLPLTTAARAPGKMKMYELSLGMIQLLIFIVSYMLLSLNFSLVVIFIVPIVANVIMLIIRLVIVRKLIHIKVYMFIRNVIVPLVCVCTISIIPSFFLHSILTAGIITSLIIISVSMITSFAAMYVCGLNGFERAQVNRIVSQKLINITRGRTT